jgi:CHAD domain-containing protein
MNKEYPVKSKKSLKENVKVILPLMYDEFMSYKESVVYHPRLKLLMHRMRITGKPMRYVMEIIEPAFDAKFKECLNDIKDIIELMGEIHDCDVNIPELISFLAEIRLYNRNLKNKTEQFSTSGILRLIQELRDNRKKMFEELCKTLDSWEKRNFKSRLLASMNVNQNIFEMRKTKIRSSVN